MLRYCQDLFDSAVNDEHFQYDSNVTFPPGILQALQRHQAENLKLKLDFTGDDSDASTPNELDGDDQASLHNSPVSKKRKTMVRDTQDEQRD